eukprot:TRINITY_DN682_c0_g1_i22.p1 TRINITY_DN682_c0_g1~~TRINITY_DN682_c0_g1_i22.p1  ORF type:complete len:315 (-),score=26.40 TRINITY_DN682_c0_g1_i22:410-1354(-)
MYKRLDDQIQRLNVSLLGATCRYSHTGSLPNSPAVSSVVSAYSAPPTYYGGYPAAFGTHDHHLSGAASPALDTSSSTKSHYPSSTGNYIPYGGPPSPFSPYPVPAPFLQYLPPPIPFYPPILAPIPVRRVETDNRLTACRDFIKGRCTKGENCKFAHVENHAAIPPGVLYHVLTRCGDFTKGVCSRTTCKYAHISNWTTLDKKYQERFSASKAGPPNFSRYCQDFRRGSCSRGETCKFSHDIELCRDFNKGSCKFSAEDCKYVHQTYDEYEKEKGKPHPDAAFVRSQVEHDTTMVEGSPIRETIVFEDADMATP